LLPKTPKPLQIVIDIILLLDAKGSPFGPSKQNTR